MKTQTQIWLIIAAVILFQVSCTNADAGSVETPAPVAEKKEKTNAKTKKKQKKSFLLVKKEKQKHWLQTSL